MSRLAVRSNVSTNVYGPSRIPRPHGHVAPSHDQTYGMTENGPDSGKPSRLQQLQADYQKQLMKDKESKLIEIFEQNQQKALQKVGGRNKGMVRDFFNERRNQGSAGSSRGNILSPSIEHVYKKKQIEHKMTQQPVNAFGYNHYSQQQQHTYKSSAGRDRSNPLAPIQRHGQPPHPFPNKPQIVRPKTYKGMSKDKENLSNKEPMPKSAPTGNFVNDNDNMSDDSPLPNAKQLEALQQKRKLLQSRKSNKSISSVQSERPNDFQKWQMDQDNQREDRLRRQREKNGMARRSVEDEGFGEENDDGVTKADMKKKQAELLAQIEAQQRELDRIRQERMREEIEEKKEMERRKRVEEERKRKQIEEEKRRRKQEEEERIRREHEEERERKLQEEKRRLRQPSERSRFEYEDSDLEEEPVYSTRRKEPSPPPHPKPAKSIARRHPVPAKTKVTPRKPLPKTGGEHVALYEDADRLEGAIESVGNLRACYNCGRKFNEDRIEKHEKACKNATKKRKVMDPSKLRTKGTEMEQYINHKQPEPKTKKNNWRSKHESFVQAIRYARKVKQIEEEGGNLADLPPPPPSENPDYVQCQYCSRKFNAQAAERHIPHCKNTRARPAAPPNRR